MTNKTKQRLPATHFNTLQGKKGTRQIGEPLPLLRTYELNGKTVKVYPPARSVDLNGEHSVSATHGKALFRNPLFPAT